MAEDLERPQMFGDLEVPSAESVLHPVEDRPEPPKRELNPVQATPAQLREEGRLHDDERSPGAVALAFEEFNPTTNLLNGLAERKFGAENRDDTWALTEELLTETQKNLGITDLGVQMDFNEYMGEAHSQAEYDYRLGRYQDSLDNQALLFKDGISTGLPALMLAYMLDPTSLTGVGVARMAPVLKGLHSASRAKRALSGAARLTTSTSSAGTSRRKREGMAHTIL